LSLCSSILWRRNKNYLKGKKKKTMKKEEEEKEKTTKD